MKARKQESKMEGIMNEGKERREWMNDKIAKSIVSGTHDTHICKNTKDTSNEA